MCRTTVQEISLPAVIFLPKTITTYDISFILSQPRPVHTGETQSTNPFSNLSHGKPDSKLVLLGQHTYSNYSYSRFLRGPSGFRPWPNLSLWFFRSFSFFRFFRSFSSRGSSPSDHRSEHFKVRLT